MIDAKELRIGNWFHPHTNGELILPLTNIKCQVGAIDKFGNITVIEHDKEVSPVYHINHCSGIALTPEVLERCGLKNLHPIGKVLYGAPYSINGTWASEELMIDFNRIGDISIRTRNGQLIKLDGIEVNSLHQLQNAVALCGQELEYKPKA